MAGDFVKQLQLAKQLEQKAKEAGKNREAAEGKIAAADALVKRIKEMGAGSVEAEKLLTEAHHQYSDKDYPDSLSYAVKAVEAAQRAGGERVKEIVRLSEELIEKVSSLVPDDVLSLPELDSAKASLDEDMDIAYGKAAGAWDAAERKANVIISDNLGKAQSLMFFSEGLNIKVDSDKQTLTKARRFIDTGDLGEGARTVKDVLDSLVSALEDEFERRQTQTEGMFGLRNRIAIDLTDTRSSLDSAKEAMEQGEFETAFERLAEAHAAFGNAFAKGAVNHLHALNERIVTLNTLGVEMAEDASLGMVVRDSARQGEYDKCLDLLDAYREGIRSQEKRIVVKGLMVVQPELQLAHSIKMDVGPVMALLEAVRSDLRADDLPSSLKKLKDAKDQLDELVAGYEDVEIALHEVQDLRRRVIDLNLQSPEATAHMKKARKLTLAKDFVGAAQAMGDAGNAFARTLENHFATDIMRTELLFALALRMGANIAEESAELDRLSEKIRQGDFELAQGSLIKINLITEEKIEFAVKAALRNAEGILGRYSGPLDVSSPADMLTKAKEALAGKDYANAYELINSSMETLHREQRIAIDRHLLEAKKLLGMAKQLNTESVLLNEKIVRADEYRSRGMTAEAAKLAEEVISFSKSIIVNELDRGLTDLTKGITAARKRGVEVAQPEHMIEEASSSLSRGDIDSTFGLLFEAKSILESITAKHDDLTERMQEMSSLLDDAERSGTDVMRNLDAMMKVRKLLESGRYDEAEATLQQTMDSCRNVVAPFMLKRRFKQLADMLVMMKRMRPAEAEEKQLAELQRNVQDLDATLEGISVLKQRMEDGISEALTNDMETCRLSLEKMRAAGKDVGSIQHILNRAMTLHKDRKFIDAMRTIELAKGELDQSSYMDRKIIDLMDQAEDVISQVDELGGRSDGAMLLLTQAATMHRSGNHSLALELARKAMADADGSAKGIIQSIMESDGTVSDEEMAWEDMSAAKRVKDRLDDALSHHRHRHAGVLARSFRDEIGKVRRDHDLAMASLVQFEQTVSDEAMRGLYSDKIRISLEKARRYTGKGAFVSALSEISASQEELRSLSEMFSSRLEEYRDLEYDYNLLPADAERKDAIHLLLADASEALKALDFERSSLSLRRAKAGITEMVAHESGRLFGELASIFKVLKLLRIDRSRFIDQANAIEHLNMERMGAMELGILVTNVGALRAMLEERFESRREEVRKDIDRAGNDGKEVGRSWELWSESYSLLKGNDILAGYTALEKSLKAVGEPASEQGNDLKSELVKLLDLAMRNHISLPLTERAYAEALDLIAEGKDAAKNIKEAWDISRKEIVTTYPDISLDLEMPESIRKGEDTGIMVKMVNEGNYAARRIGVTITGDVEAKKDFQLASLKVGEKKRGQIVIVPKSTGKMTLTVSLHCNPVLNDDEIGYDSEFEIDVE